VIANKAWQFINTDLEPLPMQDSVEYGRSTNRVSALACVMYQLAIVGAVGFLAKTREVIPGL
jgi:hypothetical protein